MSSKLAFIGATVFVVTCISAAVLAAPGTGEAEKWSFEGSRQEVEGFIEDYQTIELTPEQEAIRRAALDPVPAACCSNFSLATCCCECNLSRSIWGLSKRLIAKEGAGAEEVRETVLTWIDALNPGGYEGDTCGTGRCNLPFERSGCGGMSAERIVH